MLGLLTRPVSIILNFAGAYIILALALGQMASGFSNSKLVLLVLALLYLPSADYAAVLMSSIISLQELIQHLDRAEYISVREMFWKDFIQTGRPPDFDHLRYLYMVPSQGENARPDLKDPNTRDKLPLRVFIVKTRNDSLLAEHRAFANAAGTSYIFLCNDPSSAGVSPHEKWRAYHEFEHVKARGIYQWTHIYLVPLFTFTTALLMLVIAKSLWQFLAIPVIVVVSLVFATGIGHIIREVVADLEALRLVPLPNNIKLEIAEDYAGAFLENLKSGMTQGVWALSFRMFNMRDAIDDLKSGREIPPSHFFWMPFYVNAFLAIATFFVGYFGRDNWWNVGLLAMVLVILKLLTWSRLSNNCDAMNDEVKQRISQLIAKEA